MGKKVILVNGDLAETILQLKQQEGKDMIVYGGANFVSNLIAYGLIEKLFLLVNPVAIGRGLRIFQERTDFELVASTAYSNGIIIYQFRQQTKKE